jgi:hypothetical protein
MHVFRFQIIFMLWLGKFFSDFVWSMVRQTMTVGFKAALGGWAFVDALNLVLRRLAAFVTRRASTLVTCLLGHDDRVCRFSASICSVCDKQPSKGSHQPVILLSDATWYLS